MNCWKNVGNDRKQFPLVSQTQPGFNLRVGVQENQTTCRVGTEVDFISKKKGLRA